MRITHSIQVKTNECYEIWRKLNMQMQDITHDSSSKHLHWELISGPLENENR